MVRRVMVTLSLATVVVALANLLGALTDDGDARAAHADPETARVTASSFDAPAQPARETRPATPTTTPATIKTTPPAKARPSAELLPDDSGAGKRVVYDVSAQQVWLVAADDSVVRTYPVSGSRYDQLDTGTYQVFSRSRHATSWHGTESMEFMVRFHRGARANIGFHDIPVDTSTGVEVQTLAELGTPLSDGCIRQNVVDAAALWEFAPLGTSVVVLR
jgi:lipoprotein-anchoring transpeptidase ErfK/SrfK